jgi:DNA invertase Pin-like site-specific DNA recombinase
MADARRRKFDAVLVYRYDRFARSLRQLITVLDEFNALGIHFISLHEGVDTSTPAGRLVFGIFASIAEFERALITERVRSGQAAARRRGVRFGRPRKEFDVAELRQLRSAGLSIEAIAKQTGLGVGTVHRALTAIVM